MRLAVGLALLRRGHTVRLYVPAGPDIGLVLYEVIATRYEKKATIITSNESPTEWGRVERGPTGSQRPAGKPGTDLVARAPGENTETQHDL